MDKELPNPVKTDYEIPSTIEDSVSQLKFYPDRSNLYLGSSGWDGKLNVWTIKYDIHSSNTGANIYSQQSYNCQLGDPILSLAWRRNPISLIAGCCDGSICMADLGSTQITQIGKHEIGVSGLITINEGYEMLISSGWDGILNFWDFRQQNPCFSLNMKRRIYKMSMTYPLLMVAQSDRIVSYFNLNKLGPNFKEELTFESHLRYGTTSICCFNEPTGYVIASLEGRAAVKNIDLNSVPKLDPNNKSYGVSTDYAFRCHRLGEQSTEIYPVNAIAFNPVYGTFCTGGGDGSWNIWDKDSKTKLRIGSMLNKAPITALEYSYDGNLLAYAYGYDWHKGITYEKSFKPGINLHFLPDVEKKKKER